VNQPVNTVVLATPEEQGSFGLGWFYLLTEDYRYSWFAGDTKYRLTIRKGFRWDGASVPRLAWSVSGLTPDGPIRAAALVHDFGYRHDGVWPDGVIEVFDGDQWQPIKNVVWSRKETDRFFRWMMTDADMPEGQVNRAFKAVRLFARRW